MGQSHSDEKKHHTTAPHTAGDDKSKHVEKEADTKQTEAKQQPLPKPKKGWIIGKTEDIKKYYTLGKQLGKPGQFGYAQAVTHKTTGAQRAIKVISKARFHSDQFDHFRREIQILKTLNHPNIIKGFEVFETADKLMLVMELCEGGELFDRIKLKGQYTEKDAAKVLSQIVEGIKYLHSRKIAHCDLKPDNFLFLTSAEDSVLKIIDFGMSKFVARRQYMSVLCGTSFYIAPEVIQGKYSESCDMWSLGVVMFIMIFGFPPFHGPDDRIRRSIMRGFKPVTKEGYGPFFPAAIPASDAAKDLIAKLLTQDTAKRLTAAETLEHPWMTGEAASDTPIVRNVLQNLSDFTANCKFKQAVLGALSDKMSEDELDALKKSFKAIDANGDGTITADELKQALNSAQISESVEHIIKMADVDGDGKLSYQELVMASVHKKLMAKEERLWNTFCQLDQNGDGTVSADEIERVLGAQTNVREMISEVDKNGDGLIDYDEFVALWSAKELAANPHPPMTESDENKSED